MIQKGLINLPHFGDQTLDHYASVLQLAALVQDHGFTEIHIIHETDVDLSAKINGKTIAFEYENYNNKNLDIITKKKEMVYFHPLELSLSALLKTACKPNICLYSGLLSLNFPTNTGILSTMQLYSSFANFLKALLIISITGESFSFPAEV